MTSVIIWVIVSVYFCQSVSVSLFLSVSLPACLSVCQSVYLPALVSICLSVYVCLLACLCVCLFICVQILLALGVYFTRRVKITKKSFITLGISPHHWSGQLLFKISQYNVIINMTILSSKKLYSAIFKCWTRNMTSVIIWVIIRISFCPFVCQFVFVSVYLSVSLPACLCVYLSLSFCLSTCMCVCVCVCVCVCLSVFKSCLHWEPILLGEWKLWKKVL